MMPVCCFVEAAASRPRYSYAQHSMYIVPYKLLPVFWLRSKYRGVDDGRLHFRFGGV